MLYVINWNSFLYLIFLNIHICMMLLPLPRVAKHFAMECCSNKNKILYHAALHHCTPMPMFVLSAGELKAHLAANHSLPKSLQLGIHQSQWWKRMKCFADTVHLPNPVYLFFTIDQTRLLFSDASWSQIASFIFTHSTNSPILSACFCLWWNVTALTTNLQNCGCPYWTMEQ